MKALKNAYTVVNRAFSTGNVMTEEFDIQLQKIIETDNISLIVLDTDSRMLITSRNDQEIMSQRLWDNFFNEFENESGNMILEDEMIHYINLTSPEVHIPCSSGFLL